LQEQAKVLIDKKEQRKGGRKVPDGGGQGKDEDLGRVPPVRRHVSSKRTAGFRFWGENLREDQENTFRPAA